MKKLLPVFILMLFADWLGAQPVNITITNPPPYVIVQNAPPTNLVQVTIVQIIQTNHPPGLVEITNGVIDQKIGRRLLQKVRGPATAAFTFSLVDNDAVQFYWLNPGRWPLVFPVGTNVIWFGLSPTNQARGAVLIEAVGAEYWITP